MVEKRVKVILDGDISPYSRALLKAAAETKAFTKELDTSNDRMALLTQGALALGPALVPISAAAIPAIAGLSNQLGIGAAAAGVAILAFQGIGDTLKAVNNYAIDPTTAHFKKMNETLAALGPAGREFVDFLQKARPEIQDLQDVAQAGLLPGVEEGLRLLSGMAPDVEHIITTISTTLGGLADEAGKNLDSPKWHEFIAFLDAEARPTLQAMAYTAGNLAEGFANLWMAFGPLANNFSTSFLGLARDFSKWTDGLSQTQGFQEFISYINDVGPEAWSTLGSLANALLQIVEAAAPVGRASLPVIKAVSDAIASIADSDLGPVIVGVVSLTAAYSRLIAVGKVANTGALGSKLNLGGIVKSAADLPAATGAYLKLGSTVEKTGYQLGQFTAAQERVGTSLRGTAKLAGGAAGLAFVMSGYADKVGLANTATLALAGSMLGPEGAAIGGTIGLIKDLRSQHDGLTVSIGKMQAATDDGTLSLDQQQTAVDQLRPLIDKLRNAHGLAGDAVAGSISAFDKLAASYAANAKTAQDALFAENGLAGQMVSASQATRDQTTAVLNLRDAHNDLTDELLGAANAQLVYEKALDAAVAGGKKNKKGLDANTEAGRTNLQLLYTLAGAWGKLTPAQQNAKGASERARREFIKAAEQMGATRTEAKKLAGQYLAIPDKVATKILIDGEAEAKRAIQAVKDLLSHLPGSKTIDITTKHKNVSANPGGRADGGYITGPGGPREDKIPAMLSNGEFVVNAAATSKNLALLHSMNAQRFAAGGPVLQRMAPNNYLASAALSSPMSVSLVGARIGIDKDGFASFVDGRIEVGLAGADDFGGTVGRMNR